MNARARILLLALTVSLAACARSGAGNGPPFDGSLYIGLNTPFSTSVPIVGEFTERGTILAEEEINRAGGVGVGGKHYELRYKKLDSMLRIERSAANTRQLLHTHGLVAIVEEGVGVTASRGLTQAKNVAHWIDGTGSPSLVDPVRYPNVYRMSPRDLDQAKLLTEYAVKQRCARLALLRDDSIYGNDAGQVIKATLSRHARSLATEQSFPTDSVELQGPVRKAIASRSDCIVLWTLSDSIAYAVRSIRDAHYLVGGKPVPIYAAPPAADPALRQLLQSRPGDVDGIVFVSFVPNPIPARFADFEEKYARRFGPLDGDFKDREGREVRVPSDWQMNSYDIVYAMKAAVESAGTVDPSDGRILRALENLTFSSANGRDITFSSSNHEGFGPGDVYLAVFDDMKYHPVTPDFATLSPIDQVLMGAH